MAKQQAAKIEIYGVFVAAACYNAAEQHMKAKGYFASDFTYVANASRLQNLRGMVLVALPGVSPEILATAQSRSFNICTEAPISPRRRNVR